MSLKTASVRQSAQALLEGDVIAYPTEAVWGLGCDPFNYQAVKRLLDLKQRPVDKGLILVASSIEQIAPYLSEDLQAHEKQRLISEQDSPVTWLLPCNHLRVPPWITGAHDCVAVRISRHPVVVALCDAAGLPIVSTSANPAGCLPARELFQVRRYFGDSLTVCQGRIGTATKPSTIKDIKSDTIIRE